MATDGPSCNSVSTLRRSKVHGAVAMNTLVLSLFISSAELGTTTSGCAAPRTVTLANMLGLRA